jgi:hypothetical protein
VFIAPRVIIVILAKADFCRWPKVDSSSLVGGDGGWNSSGQRTSTESVQVAVVAATTASASGVLPPLAVMLDVSVMRDSTGPSSTSAGEGGMPPFAMRRMRPVPNILAEFFARTT